jgi:uncharacterized membrane protein YqaE (UPF0057 family)
MRYLLAILFPPLAVMISKGGFFTTFFNVILTCLIWVPGIIHALLVVNEYKTDKRTDKLIKAMGDK